jgi:hypothetical protein
VSAQRYFMLWISDTGVRCWSGPHDTIEGAREHVPESANATLCTLPLPAMTPGEWVDAGPILCPSTGQRARHEQQHEFCAGGGLSWGVSVDTGRPVCPVCRNSPARLNVATPASARMQAAATPFYGKVPNHVASWPWWGE